MKAVKTNATTVTFEQRIYGPKHGCDIYVIAPTDIPLNAAFGSELEFFHNSLTFKHSYSSSQFLLPLLKSQYHLLDEQDNFRNNTSLFAFHFNRSISKTASKIIEVAKVDPELITKEVDDFISLTNEIKGKFRMVTPAQEANFTYFQQVDNYLSWKTEQAYLKLANKLPKHASHTPTRKKLMRHAKLEQSYRIEKNYNSKGTQSNPNRLSNKMRLLKRIIEAPVVIGERLYTNGKHTAYTIKALTTAFMMFFVLLIMRELQDTSEQLGMLFIVSLCAVYGAREIVREEFLSHIWSLYDRRRAKWTFVMSDNFTRKIIGRRNIYLDFSSPSKQKRLPDYVRSELKTTGQVQVLHLGTRSTFEKGNFNPNYNHSQEQINMDLRDLFFLTNGSARKIYTQSNGRILEKPTETRVALAVVVAYKNTTEGDIKHQKYKVVINSKEIVTIEKA
ncbi:hypothetical protein [Vibrio owensii]|uniref:hypothetical protein n=1 Tax=Vibrio owensii TaxID=696485 RepID=UPI0018F20253|nr:hypothetical protein [Vibrio owensii]